jgi:hypothetical protein
MTEIERFQRRHHVSPAQKALLAEFLAHDNRPTDAVYREFQQRMKLVDPKEKPKAPTIPNTSKGFEAGEVKLGEEFDARKDLPEGWGVLPMYDSGSNFKIQSAGQILLTKFMNYWGSTTDMRSVVEFQFGVTVAIRQASRLLCKKPISFKVNGKGRTIHFKEGQRFWVSNTMLEQRTTGLIKVGRLASYTTYNFTPEMVRDHFDVED